MNFSLGSTPAPHHSQGSGATELEIFATIFQSRSLSHHS